MDEQQRKQELEERDRQEAERQWRIDREDQRKRAEYLRKRNVEQKKEWEAIEAAVASKRVKKQAELAEGFKQKSKEKLARKKAEEKSRKEAKRLGQSGSRRAEVHLRQDLPHGTGARSPSRLTQPKRTPTPETGGKWEQERSVREVLFPPAKKTPPAATSMSTWKPTEKSSVSKSSSSQLIPSQADIPSTATGGMGKYD